MSNSVIVNIFLKLYKKIDSYYENSLLHKAVCYIFRIAAFSFIARFFVSVLTKEQNKHFRANSIFFGIIDKVAEFFNNIIQKIFDWLKKISEASIICSGVRIIVLPLKSLGAALNSIFIVLTGFFFIRLIALTVKHGFALNILIINGAMLMGFAILSLICVTALDAAFKGSIGMKLVEWFFTEQEKES